MINIPTELLRTLLAVVDMRSFTKAARALGVTQPAVSAQIKRLQSLLGFDLFDKSAPGVSVTEKGERVVCEARRLLAINDQIVSLAGASGLTAILRVGVPVDCIGMPFWQRLLAFRKRWPAIGLHMSIADGASLLEEMRRGDLDVVVAMSCGRLDQPAAHHWRDELVWVRGAASAIEPTQPVQILNRGEHCLFHQAMTRALEAAGRRFEVVLTTANLCDLTEAAAAGLGVTALPRALALSLASNTNVCAEDSLPKLTEIVCSVSVRNDTDPGVINDMAKVLAEALQPPPVISVPRPDKMGQTATHRIPAA